MTISNNDRQVLRDLATRVAEIGAQPEQAVKRGWWKRHNRLEKVKPMVLIFPEGAWSELLPDSVLATADPWARRFEWHLRHLLYRWEHLRDDNTIEPVLKVGLAYSSSGWGFPIENVPSTTARGAWAFKPTIVRPEDSARMTPPQIEVNEQATRENFERVRDLFGDILEVRLHRRAHVDTSLIGTLCRMRGLEQVMMDMCERPAWLHGVLHFMMESSQGLLDWVERHGYLDLNNRDDYVGSGGVAYTDELPKPGFNGRARLCDLWGFAEAQEFAQVSPAMHEEFALQYQIPLLARFGLNCYGCCESLTEKLEAVKKIPGLRRVSVSPWTDVHVAAESLQDKFIFSWKPNPTDMVMEFDEDRIRAKIGETLAAAKDCVLEMILKDTHTCEHEPWRMQRWVEIAQEMTAR